MKTLKHKFVDIIPDDIEEGVIYISILYSTAIHKCCCGCGSEVITPFSPTQWSLIFDGESVTLDPSIGNWSFKCKSHYFIKNNKIKWSRIYDDDEIENSRSIDFNDNYLHFKKKKKKTT